MDEFVDKLLKEYSLEQSIKLLSEVIDSIQKDKTFADIKDYLETKAIVDIDDNFIEKLLANSMHLGDIWGYINALPENYDIKKKDVDLFYALNLKPEKAIEYFEKKGYMFSWNWDDHIYDEHARAFTSAKAMRQDILEDLRGMVDKALEEGITLEQFKEELTPKLKAKGWWGFEKINNKVVEFGTPRRLEIIYRTNLQVAYNRGRYEAHIENTEDRPYWQYVSVIDPSTRVSHSAMNGKVFRYDDKIWETWYPPNGFNCRCRVRVLDGEDIKEKKLKVLKGSDINTNVIKPDKLWDYNPAKNYKDIVELKPKITPESPKQDVFKQEDKEWESKGKILDKLLSAKKQKLIDAEKNTEDRHDKQDKFNSLIGNLFNKFIDETYNKERASKIKKIRSMLFSGWTSSSSSGQSGVIKYVLDDLGLTQTYYHIEFIDEDKELIKLFKRRAKDTIKTVYGNDLSLLKEVIKTEFS